MVSWHCALRGGIRGGSEGRLFCRSSKINVEDNLFVLQNLKGLYSATNLPATGFEELLTYLFSFLLELIELREFRLLLLYFGYYLEFDSTGKDKDT